MRFSLIEELSRGLYTLRTRKRRCTFLLLSYDSTKLVRGQASIFLQDSRHDNNWPPCCILTHKEFVNVQCIPYPGVKVCLKTKISLQQRVRRKMPIPTLALMPMLLTRQQYKFRRRLPSNTRPHQKPLLPPRL